MNCVRKHLSAIKGGRLARAAAPAEIVSLIISDVPGDDPSVIASGPTVADARPAPTRATVLTRYGIDAARSRAGLARQRRGGDAEAGRSRLRARDQRASSRRRKPRSRPRPASRARPAIAPLILGDAIEGEAREVGRVMAASRARWPRMGSQSPRPAR